MTPRPRVVFSFAVYSLILLLALSIGCSQKESEQQAASKSAAASSHEAGQQAADLNSLLPSEQEANGWKPTGEPRTYLPDNLWEYIDGGAEGYLVYNFKAVITADYETVENPTQAVVDIYKMANQLCGFGIYSTERDNQATKVDIGTEGYVSDNAVHFWQGPYYVKATSFETGKTAELEKLARAVAGKLDAPVGDPPQLAAFPKQGLVEGSQRYMAQDVLGHSELKNGFSADYKLDGKEFKLFFILHDTAEQASHSFTAYREFMQKYSQSVKDGAVDNPLFTAQDSYYGKVVAMQSGRALLVVLGLDDPEEVNKYLQELTENLSSQGLV